MCNEYFSLLVKGTFEEIKKYKKEKYPDYLYKFYSLSNKDEHDDLDKDYKKLNTLKNNHSWFELAENQNDPFDLKMGCIEDNPNAKDLLDRFRETMGYCCFTELDYNSLPMWAHYANNHYGFCIKYKTENKKALFKVYYEKELIKINNLVNSLLCTKRTENKLIYLLHQIMSVKHISWKAEKEYRFFCPKENTDKKGGFELENKTVGISAEKLYIGYNCNYEEELKKIARENLGCRVYKMEISETEFLKLKEI